MKSPVVIDYSANTITIRSKTFARAASRVGTPEYKELQEVRREHPNFRLLERQIRKNTSAEHYHGLTYEYMRSYIESHESDKTQREQQLALFDEFLLISKCHSTGKRYATIKSWFLDQYPAVKEFGVKKEDEASSDETDIPKLLKPSQDQEEATVEELPLASGQ